MKTPKVTHILNRRDGTPAFVEFITEGKSKLLSIKHFRERYQLTESDLQTPTNNEHLSFSALDAESPEVA